MNKISNIVTIQNIKKWNCGDTITITAGTGKGKSYFIKNNLYALAKKDNAKILMLIHRDNCINQFEEEIKSAKKIDIIDLKTYQKLEHKELNQFQNDLSKYKYIVCDEFHYFMSDAAFSKTTDISLNVILRQSNAIKIFMSATGDTMKKYLNKVKGVETTDYSIPITFDFIDELKFFNTDETLESLLEECIETNSKCIAFIESAQKAYELHKKFEDNSIFNCSKSNSKYKKYIKKYEIESILKSEKFDKNILITTTCMDAGVNIWDDKLQHIICDVKDIGVLIQCIGRKRFEDHSNEKIYLYIKSVSNKRLGGMQTKLEKKIKMADFLMEHTVNEFIKKYPREYDISNIIYDEATDEDDKSTKKINELMYFKCKEDINDIKKMLDKKLYKNFGYNRFIANKFGINYNDIVLLEESKKEDQLRIYLNKNIDRLYLKDDKDELIKTINLTDSRGRIQKSPTLLKEYLESNFNLTLKSNCETSRVVDGEKKKFKSCWKILKFE